MAGPGRRKRLKRFLRYLALRPFFTVLGAVPRPLGRAIGTAYGRFAYAILPTHRATCRRERLAAVAWIGTLKRIPAPTPTSAAISRPPSGPHRASISAFKTPHFERRVFEWLGRAAVDFLRLGRDPASGNAAKVEGLSFLEETERSARPTIFATAHFGNWEALGGWLAARERPVDVLYHPFPEERLNRYVAETRRRAGVGLIPVQGSALPIRRALKDGRVIGVLLDRVPKQGGVPSQFFGKPCLTDPGTARLSLMTGALVLVAAMWEDLDGGQRIRFWQPLDPKDFKGRENAVSLMVRELDKRVEEMISAAPTEWPWFYPRWKTRESAPPFRAENDVRRQNEEAETIAK